MCVSGKETPIKRLHVLRTVTVMSEKTLATLQIVKWITLLIDMHKAIMIKYIAIDNYSAYMVIA